MLYEKKQDYAALLPKLNHHISYCDDVPLSFQSVFQSLDQEHWLTEDRSCSCQSNLVCINIAVRYRDTPLAWVHSLINVFRPSSFLTSLHFLSSSLVAVFVDRYLGDIIYWRMTMEFCRRRGGSQMWHMQFMHYENTCYYIIYII